MTPRVRRGTLPGWGRCLPLLDTLGFEPRGFRMRSGCDTTTPCAPMCVPSQVNSIHNYLGNFRAAPLHEVSLGTSCRRGSDAIWVWTHWGLSPGPSTCEADVLPLHHLPHACIFTRRRRIQLFVDVWTASPRGVLSRSPFAGVAAMPSGSSQACWG